MTTQGEKTKASASPLLVCGALVLVFGVVMTLMDAITATSVGIGGPAALILGAVLVSVFYFRQRRVN